MRRISSKVQATHSAACTTEDRRCTEPDCEPSVGESVSLFREPDAGNLPSGSMSGNRKPDQAKPDQAKPD